MVRGAKKDADEDDLNRSVTHSFSDYTLTNQKAARERTRYSTVVHKEITVDFNGVAYEQKELDQDITSDQYITFPTNGMIVPLLGGGISLFFSLGLYIARSGELSDEGWFIVSVSGGIFLFFLVFLFTKPNKELILDRLNGIITFPGFFWQKNITMKFSEIIFTYSTGGEDGLGAFKLQIMRPHGRSIQSYESFDLCGGCYESMSLVTWYMDKNRPLPPGSAFDPYRQQDYERRKAQGFPEPLYPSSIPTPDATKKQQVERKRIGGW